MAQRVQDNGVAAVDRDDHGSVLFYLANDPAGVLPELSNSYTFHGTSVSASGRPWSTFGRMPAGCQQIRYFASMTGAEGYDALIQLARERLSRPASARLDAEHDLGGDEVQLSVRLPAGLRTAVADAANRRGQSVTRFVTEALRKEVHSDADPFAGLAVDLTERIRSALAAAVRAGDYAAAAAAVDAAEQDA